MICGLVDVEGKIKTKYGEAWCSIDVNQYSEEERISAMVLNISVEELRNRNGQKKIENV
jgi:hypothetical protein